MRKQLPLGALVFFLCCLQTFAQKPTTQWTGYLTPDPEPTAASAARYAPGTVDPRPNGVCVGTDAVGSASNVFTHILTEANPVAADNDLNTILYVHRNNAGVFGGHSGQLRYDITTDGGGTWTNNLGVLNPLSVNGTNGARYPNAGIYNPAGNTNPNNAYLGYYASTVAATFNGTVNGVRKLDGTGNTETYNQPTATQTLIPRSMVKGAPGIYWAIDNVYNGSQVTGYRVLKGTWNGSTDIVWTVSSTINPTFNTAYDGAPKTSDYAIAFDPSGNIGWICMLTHLTPGPGPYSFYPVFYKSDNGGSSWSGPFTVDLGQYPCITSNILVGNVASTAFDLDLTVDVNGNPHAVTTVCNGNNAYAVFFTQWHAIVDITMSNGVWNPVILRNVYRGRGTWGTAPNQVTLDMEPQAARTADGTKVFFTWCDADSSVLLATADQNPNLYGKGYDVVSQEWTDADNLTQCNVTWNGKILFPKMAETVLSNTGNYKLPIVFAELGAGLDPINPANFHYLDSIWYHPSQFTNPQCQGSVSISAQDTIYGCGSVVLDAGAGAQQYAWSNGAITQAITVSTSGTYSVGVSQNCCTAADTVVVIMVPPPTATFFVAPNGFTMTFINTSVGPYNSYFWDFGDGNSSTAEQPVHTYSTPGTYMVCFTVTNVCGTDSMCMPVQATCPQPTAAWTHTTNLLTANFTDATLASVISWDWDFGDGNSSSLQNPSHTYTAAGTYYVCLTITDSCGPDTHCDSVAVCEVPVAQFSAVNSGPGIADFTDQSTGATSWAWTFGDGATSNLQNPSHTYLNTGTYLVCLTVTNACGTDSSCQNVFVLLEAIGDGMPGEWRVFPIPARDVLQVSAVDAGTGPVQLRVMNALGQILMERAEDHAGGGLQTELDVRGLANGIYYLEVRTELGVFAVKVVKE
jgi:PKD repeat protein